MEDKEQEKQPEVVATTETKEPSTEATTPTAEERLQSLQAEHDKTQQSLRSLQGILKQKDLTIKQQGDVNSRIEAINDRLELLATAYASGQKSEEEVANLPKEDRNKVLEQIKQMKQAEIARNEQQKIIQKGLEFKERVEAAGLTESDEAYWELEDLVSRGKISYAETKLKKIEKEKKAVGEKPTKTVEQQAEELAEKKYQERLKKEGLLKTDTLSPSGGKGRTPTLEELRAASPEETEKKVKSGEWKIRGWVS